MVTPHFDVAYFMRHVHTSQRSDIFVQHMHSSNRVLIIYMEIIASINQARQITTHIQQIFNTPTRAQCGPSPKGLSPRELSQGLGRGPWLGRAGSLCRSLHFTHSRLRSPEGEDSLLEAAGAKTTKSQALPCMEGCKADNCIIAICQWPLFIIGGERRALTSYDGHLQMSTIYV